MKIQENVFESEIKLNIFYFRPVDHVHRADQESDLQLLEARVRPLRAGDPEALRVGGQVLHGPLGAQDGHGRSVGRLRKPNKLKHILLESYRPHTSSE